MATLVGRVGLVVKGAWDSSVAYAAMDVVTYGNSTYIAKQAVPAETLPTNTTYWELSLDASLLQPKTMSSPVTIGGESKTTVEAAVGALEDAKADKAIPTVAGNIAALNATGNLVDSGIEAGNTSISGIGDGSVTGALKFLNESNNRRIGGGVINPGTNVPVDIDLSAYEGSFTGKIAFLTLQVPTGGISANGSLYLVIANGVNPQFAVSQGWGTLSTITFDVATRGHIKFNITSSYGVVWEMGFLF